MTQQQLALIWEVLANVGTTAPDAAAALERQEGIIVTVAEAQDALIAAKKRNSLKLVTDRADVSQRSTWLHRRGSRD